MCSGVGWYTLLRERLTKREEEVGAKGGAMILEEMKRVIREANTSTFQPEH